jgi:hypothetical protein
VLLVTLLGGFRYLTIESRSREKRRLRLGVFQVRTTSSTIVRTKVQLPRKSLPLAMMTANQDF